MSLTHLTDEALVSGLQDLLIDERENLVQQLEHIAEMDRRKLFYHYPSLRAYLVEEKGMEEWLAERRIRLARLLRRFPHLKAGLESGKLNSTLLELALGCAYREKLSDPELGELLESISGMSCRRAAREIARLYPETTEVPRDRIRPISEDLSEVRFVASQGLLEKIDEIRGLLAHSHPGASLAEIIDVLATEYRERHHPEEKARRAQVRAEKKKTVQVDPAVDEPAAPRPAKVERRTPTASMTHELTLMDGYRCAYVDSVTGRRCESTFALEKDHCQGWAQGGKTEVSNLRYLCRSHHRRVTFLSLGQ